MVTGNTFQPTVTRYPHQSNTVEGRETVITVIEEPTRIDEVSSTLTYLGFADLGSVDGDAVWKIKRLEQSGNVTTITFADGNRLHDNVWSDRASLNYS